MAGLRIIGRCWAPAFSPQRRAAPSPRFLLIFSLFLHRNARRRGARRSNARHGGTINAASTGAAPTATVN